MLLSVKWLNPVYVYLGEYASVCFSPNSFSLQRSLLWWQTLSQNICLLFLCNLLVCFSPLLVLPFPVSDAVFFTCLPCFIMYGTNVFWKISFETWISCDEAVDLCSKTLTVYHVSVRIKVPRSCWSLCANTPGFRLLPLYNLVTGLLDTNL